MISAGSDSFIRIWDMEREYCDQVLLGHEKGILCLDISGQTLITGSADSTIRLWDLRATNEKNIILGNHLSSVFSVHVFYLFCFIIHFYYSFLFLF